MSAALLPYNAQPYELAIADANDSYTRLKGFIPDLPHVGRDLFPEGWLPWLMRNAGMQMVMAHVPAENWLAVYQQRAWLYIRGTGNAHVQAQSWIGFEATYRDGPVDTPYYDWFDVILDRMPIAGELEPVVGLGFAAKSTASFYHRVIFGLDVPAARAAHDAYGNALRGFYSGVEWRSGWPKLSIRATIGGGVDSDDEDPVHVGVMPVVGGHATAERHLRFGYSRRCFDLPGPWRTMGVVVLTSDAGDAQDAPHSRLPHFEGGYGERPLLAGEASEYEVSVSEYDPDNMLRFAHSRRAYNSFLIGIPLLYQGILTLGDQPLILGDRPLRYSE